MKNKILIAAAVAVILAVAALWGSNNYPGPDYYTDDSLTK